MDYLFRPCLVQARETMTSGEIMTMYATMRDCAAVGVYSMSEIAEGVLPLKYFTAAEKSRAFVESGCLAILIAVGICSAAAVAGGAAADGSAAGGSEPGVNTAAGCTAGGIMSTGCTAGGSAAGGATVDLRRCERLRAKNMASAVASTPATVLGASRWRPSRPCRASMGKSGPDYSTSPHTPSANIPRPILKAADFVIGMGGTYVNKVEEALKSMGLAVLEVPEVTSMLSKTTMASAETLGLTGDMVFAGPVLDKDQRHIDEGGGSVKMSSGTGQRLMADAKKSKELQPLLLAVSKVIAPIAAHLGVTEQKSVVLVNKTGPQPVGTQAFHTDTDAGVPGFIAILPFQEKTTMLVACGSRWAVHLAGSRQEKDGVTDEEIAAGIPKWTVARLVMEPGQLVLLDGNTVHAGDAGAPGQTSVRLHWYFMKEPLDNATYPITMLGKVFASLFK